MVMAQGGGSGLQEPSPDGRAERGQEQEHRPFEFPQRKETNFCVLVIFTFSEKGLKLSQTELFPGTF